MTHKPQNSQDLVNHILNNNKTRLGLFIKQNRRSAIRVSVNQSFSPELNWCFSVSVHKYSLTNTVSGYHIARHTFYKNYSSLAEASEAAKGLASKAGYVDYTNYNALPAPDYPDNPKHIAYVKTMRDGDTYCGNRPKKASISPKAKATIKASIRPFNS